MFKVNEAIWDRIACVVLGIVLLYLDLGGVVAGGLGVVLDIFGAIFLLTGLVGFCPLYMLFKFSTKKWLCCMNMGSGHTTPSPSDIFS